jgi:hypothetical protein
MSLRRAVARPVGEDEQAVLRLVDSFLADPKPWPDDVLPPRQLAELAFQLACFSSNKTNVALGLDAPVDEDAFSLLRYEDGAALVEPGRPPAHHLA